jgi:plastocyanin
MLWIGSVEAATIQVKMTKLAFEPAEVQAQVGDTIEWVNQDIFRHTATARDGRFDVDLAPGAVGSSRLDRPGALEVYCRFHPGMKLKLLVNG